MTLSATGEELRVVAATSPSTASTSLAAIGAGEERRLVTALFCDLAGFTPLSERLSGEEVRELQTAYFERMRREIERFGGLVEKFAGDAVLALFGVPTAREDDAERAVRCALSMQAALSTLAAEVAERWSATLALRVGVNTGEAVGGIPEAAEAGAYAAVTGDVVNTAARLQTAAESGRVMVGEQTMELTRRSIEYGERRELTLKGKAGVVPAYEVIGLRERLVERWEAGRRRTPLVGRERDLELLLQSWELALQARGQLVMLVADAGVGKSRLLAEAIERILLTGEARELRGRCLSHGQDISLGLVADLLRTCFELSEQSDRRQVQMQIATGVDAILRDHDEDTRMQARDVFGEVLGLSVGGSSVSSAGAQARRQVLIKSLRFLLAGFVDEVPAVLVLEDLHWIDIASAEVLGDVLADVPELRLLVLTAQRPGRILPWADWSWVERLSLRALDNRHASALAGAVLGDADLSPELEEYVAERAGGNPFYIEELLQALQSAGGLVRRDGRMQLVAEAAEWLPATLTEILLARLDRLEAQVRGLVQVARVIGRTFAVDLLAEVIGEMPASLEPWLEKLPRADIAFPRLARRSEYVFKHITVRDVAYNTLLQRRRQELHSAVARAIEALYPTDEYVEVVAYHYAKSENHQDAAVWLERAGDRAADMYSNQAAISHYEEARKRLRQAGASELIVARVSSKLGTIFRVVAWYDEALEELEAAAEACRMAGDLDGQARTAAQIGQVHFLRGAREEGIRSIRDVLDRLTADQEGVSPEALADLSLALVEPLYDAHRFDEALAAAERAAALIRPIEDRRRRLRVDVLRTRALQGSGRLEEARRLGGETLELAQAEEDLESVVNALTWMGDTVLILGQPEEAVLCYERALQAGAHRGDLAQRAYVLGELGQALFVVGRWEGAAASLEAAVELVRSISFAYFSASILLRLGEQYLLLGESEKASRYLEEPFTIAERSGRLEDAPYLQIPLAERDLFSGDPAAALDRLRPLLAGRQLCTADDHRAMRVAAEATLAVGEADAAEALVSDGLAAAESQGYRLAVAEWLRVRGMTAAGESRWDDAGAALETALTAARQIPYPYGEARILHAYAEMWIARGELERAQGLLRQALSIFQQLGAHPWAVRIEKALAESVPSRS